MAYMKTFISVLIRFSSARRYSLAGMWISKASRISFRSGSSTSINRYRSPGRRPFEAVYGELPDAAGPQRVSFTNLEIYWNVVLGIFMCGANTGIKLIYQSIRDEQTMTELKHQNLQAEMDYLKYQINPHFFMNTLNNIHALIDIDADSAKSAVIDLSKMIDRKSVV